MKNLFYSSFMIQSKFSFICPFSAVTSTLPFPQSKTPCATPCASSVFSMYNINEFGPVCGEVFKGGQTITNCNYFYKIIDVDFREKKTKSKQQQLDLVWVSSLTFSCLVFNKRSHILKQPCIFLCLNMFNLFVDSKH